MVLAEQPKYLYSSYSSYIQIREYDEITGEKVNNKNKNAYSEIQIH
jgi:hypothetical protein